MLGPRGYKIIVVFLILLCAGGYAIWDMVRTPGTVQNYTTQVPDFSFDRLSGGVSNLYDYRARNGQNQIILVNLWASWCVPCVKEFPDLVALAKLYPDDLTIVALSVDDTKEDAEKFTGKMTIPDNMTVGFDQGKTIARTVFQAEKYPESYIITPGFYLHRRISGAYDWISPDFKAYMDERLSGEGL